MSPSSNTTTLQVTDKDARVVSRFAVVAVLLGIFGNMALAHMWPMPPLVLSGALKLSAVLGICSLATTAEDLLYRRLRGRARFARVSVQIVLSPLVVLLGIAGALSLGGFLSDLGDRGTTHIALLTGGVWLGSASMGSLVVLLLDGVAARVVSTVRAQLNLVVVALIGLAVSVAYGAAQLGPEIIRFVERLENTPFGARFGLDSVWLWETSRALGPGDAVELLALVYFVVLAIVGLPAILSASGKLAASIMQGLEPLEAGFEAVARGELDFRVPVGGRTEFSRFSETFNDMVQTLALGKRMERAFGSYVSKEILQQIRSQHGQATLEPSLRIATVFFVDIRGFTTMSERINPKQLLAVLNRFYESVATVVDEHKGFLVQYVGDAVVVVFNGPIDQPDHAFRAADCAIGIQKAVSSLNEAAAFPEIGQLLIGIGIATGPLVAGNLGDSRHLLQYTVLGDTVNQAARLTQHVPPGAIWCNERNADSISRRHKPLVLESIKVKGRARRLLPHQLWPNVDYAEITEVLPLHG